MAVLAVRDRQRDGSYGKTPELLITGFRSVELYCLVRAGYRDDVTIRRTGDVIDSPADIADFEFCCRPVSDGETDQRTVTMTDNQLALVGRKLQRGDNSGSG